MFIAFALFIRDFPFLRSVTGEGCGHLHVLLLGGAFLSAA
jgi:hypothetical protein